MRLLASALGALALLLAGCGGGDGNRSITRSPGVNPKPVQPTTGTVGTKAPTPPARTTTANGGTTG